MRNSPLTTLIALLISTFLVLTVPACGGGGGSDAGGSFGTGGDGDGGFGGDGDGDGDGDSTGSTTGISIGSFDSGNAFQEGDISIGQSPLAAGGSSSLAIAFVDEDGVPVSQSITVTFLSICLAQGKAEIRDASGSVVGSVATISGGAKATYVDKGCAGTDELFARATIGEDELEATGSIEILPASVGGLQFISATPSVIGIKGTGILPESSQVVFQVNDSSGNAAPGKTVDFSLDTTVGGITLSTPSGTSGADGRVSVVVTSGTQATSVRVRAQTLGGGGATLTSQSDALAITTGVADANSFSLSAEVLNPQGFDFDGETSDISILAGDTVNNPVPDGFNINFSTEGGVIEGSCKTNDNSNPQQQPVTGGCSVQWTSQDPRPALDGRTTILASALGVESFTDNDGDNQFDDGESFDDLGEPFSDENENGSYDVGEHFIDTNTNGVRDGGNGMYDGLLCDPTATMCNKGTITIGKNMVLVMAESVPAITPSFVPPLNVAEGTITTVSFLVVGDTLGQVLPLGTSVGLTSVGGGGFTVIAPASLDVGNTNADPGLTSDTIFSFAIRAPNDCSTPVQDIMNLTVNIPDPGAGTFFFQFGVECP